MSEDFQQLPGKPKEPARPLKPSEPITPEQLGAAQPQDPPQSGRYTQAPGAHPFGTPAAFVPPVSGNPPPGNGEYGYGFPPPSETQPLPLEQAIRELPGQYKKILLRPGVRSFWEEQGKAAWGIIGVQLLLQISVYVLLNISDLLSNSVYNRAINTSGASWPLSTTFFPLESLGWLLFGQALLFAYVGIQFALAKAFKGSGSFMQQLYNQLLFLVPLDIVASVFTRVLGGLLTYVDPYSTHMGVQLTLVLLQALGALGIGVYILVLNVYSLMAVHRFSGGKATASVLIPLGTVFLVLFIGVFLAVFSFAMAASHL
jgi:hypothetical protein